MLNYGKGMLSVGLPDDLDVTVVTKRPMEVLVDPSAAVADALAHPVGSLPLAHIARGARSACILVCDVTRPVPNGLFLPQLVRTCSTPASRPRRSRSWWRRDSIVRT